MTQDGGGVLFSSGRSEIGSSGFARFASSEGGVAGSSGSLLLKTVAHDATALALLCSGDREWETKALQQVRRQRYLNQDTALEMVFADDQPHGGTVLFNFPHSSQGSGCEDSSEVSI